MVQWIVRSPWSVVRSMIGISCYGLRTTDYGLRQSLVAQRQNTRMLEQLPEREPTCQRHLRRSRQPRPRRASHRLALSPSFAYDVHAHGNVSMIWPLLVNPKRGFMTLDVLDMC